MVAEMLRKSDSNQPTVAALSNLTTAIDQIQRAATEHERLLLLGDIATNLVGAARAVARSGQELSGDPGAVAFPLVGSASEAVGVLEVVPRDGVTLTDGDVALLRHLAKIGACSIEGGRLRQQLVVQDDRLRLALEAASVGTWEHIPTTHATYWDERSKAIFGYGKDDDFTFDGYVSALHPDDKEYVFAGIARATDPQSPGECSLEYRIRRVDGTERWVEAHGRCIFVDGVPQRIHGTLVDITVRKHAEQAIREAAHRKDEFLAVLGHELRNPLAPILTALELMRLRAPEHAVREREVIERQVRHMMRLVDDLLDLARIARGAITLDRERCDLAVVVERAAEIASPLFEGRRHRLEIDVPAGLAIDVDAVRFTQAVSNLLTNAAKFTAPGGRIAVRGRMAGEEIAVDVEDDGIGIAPGDLKTIFEPFVQAADLQDRNGGLGLGLSLVRDLVHLHGGRVTAESEGLGRGSRFVIHLPPAADRGHATAASQPPRPRVAGRHRILIVDDNKDATEMLSLALGELGHVVGVAHDGPEALRVAAELQPDVAVLDLGLPVMDGYELASRLLETYGAQGIRLVAVTGYGQVKDQARTRAAGFLRHLVKPVDLKELQAALSA
jgi:PAS domain S-box-containing protein